ncbi:MAG: hypothetical protein KGJ79_07730 [Alphaproteobacteria bacterium]|nr:hypothetical protein [Alphaproteobacteria bacterium]MDE2111016.1 hypothetical protein [Alphaproteobacteria bacterium]MDE2493823.1 hypothetical protein [Alphaproteobacteria bacterium]
MVYTSGMSRSAAFIIAAVLTLAVAGAFTYWGLGGLIHPPSVVHEPLAAVRNPVVAIEVPPGWQQIDTKQGFSFYVPPGTQFHQLPGTDSFLGEITGPTFVLQYDFGFYSNDLSDAENNPDYSEKTMSVDGRNGLVRQATLREAEGWPYFIGLYIQQAVFHAAYPGRWAALEIHGTVASPQDRATVEQIFQTIRFDKSVVKNTK